MLEIERLESGAVTVLRVHGDVNEEGVNTLRLALMKCIEEGRNNVVLNVAGVAFVSYMGVGVLVERLGQLQAAKGDLKLACLSVYMRRLLRLMGLSHVFNCYETEAQAIQGCAKQAAA